MRGLRMKSTNRILCSGWQRQRGGAVLCEGQQAHTVTRAATTALLLLLCLHGAASHYILNSDSLPLLRGCMPFAPANGAAPEQSI
jgi:hypothetical protein